jgi:hypothetical protein
MQGEITVKDYLYKLIEAHAHNQHQQSTILSLLERTRQTEEEVRVLQGRKERFEQIAVQLRSECSGLNGNSELQTHFTRRAVFLLATQERHPRITANSFPKIAVAEMGWALEYLEGLREEGLRELEETQTTHRKGKESLVTMLGKY